MDMETVTEFHDAIRLLGRDNITVVYGASYGAHEFATEMIGPFTPREVYYGLMYSHENVEQDSFGSIGYPMVNIAVDAHSTTLPPWGSTDEMVLAAPHNGGEVRVLFSGLGNIDISTTGTHKTVRVVATDVSIGGEPTIIDYNRV